MASKQALDRIISRGLWVGKNNVKTSDKTINLPATPCRVTTPTSTKIWFPDTGMGRALRERLEKEGWERIPQEPEDSLGYRQAK